MQKQIIAAFDENGVFVYQAFRPSIADAALAKGTFGKGFNLDRITWIKPSFGWMLYRSRYATMHRQERVLRIKLSHSGFLTILRRGVPTSYDPSIYCSEQLWQQALAKTEVRYQWDPDRDLFLRRLERRAIQLGIAGQTVREYVNQWIVDLEDVTDLAKAVQLAVTKSTSMPNVAVEQIYPLDEAIHRHLGILPPHEAK